MTNTLQQAKDRIRRKYHGATIETGNEPDDLVLLGEVERLENINRVLVEACKSANSYLSGMVERGVPKPGEKAIAEWSFVQTRLYNAIAAAEGSSHD